MAGLFGSGSATAANTLGDLSKDIQLNNGPEDSISHISFSPQSDHLAVASWDKKVRIYEVNAQGGEGKALFEHEGPVLSCDWSKVCGYCELWYRHKLIFLAGWYESLRWWSGQGCSYA